MPENIFIFVGDDGENIHIDAEALRIWCKLNKPEIFWIPLKHELLQQFMDDNVISPQRIVELNTRKDLDPIIMVKDGKMVILMHY
jgi:hypothetical protein